jgi:putative ABC transport system permease protein
MKKPLAPPKLAERLLSKLLRDDLAEEVLGDLEEKFYATVEKKSTWRAKLNYWYQAFNYLRPFALRKRSYNSNKMDMLSNYIKTAGRHLRKNKLHSFINTAGLSGGMAVAILIGLWIWDELSYNKYHENYEHVAQVIQNVSNNGEIQTWRTAPYPLAEELRSSYGSDFKEVILTSGQWEMIMAVGDKKLTKTGLFVEPKLPEVLTLKMLAGNRNGLQEPASILLSASLARAYFGDADPIGQQIQVDNRMNVFVTGVYEDLPSNSTFKDVSFFAPWRLYYDATEWVRTMSDPWRPNAFHIFVELPENADLSGISDKIKDAKLKKVSAELAKKQPQLFLDPMSKWHLYSDFENGINVGGRIKYVWMFGIIGGFVLLMACINFMNLSTARSEKRAREIGIRKAIGSHRSHLIAQFFTESVLVATLSFVLAIIIVQLSMPFFNEVADKEVAILWNSTVFWMIGIGFTLFTGLIAGSYPALYLSSIQSVRALKGTYKAGRMATIPRKVLVVVQFSISFILIVGTLVVFKQIEFARNRPLGYDSNGLVAMPLLTNDIHNHFEAVKTELTNTGTIVEMAESESPLTSTWSTTSGFDWPGKDPALSVDFPTVGVSFDFGKTIGWEIVQGRDFSKDFGSDSSAVILNEAATAFMSLPNPVGETVKWFGDPLKVVGVVKDVIASSPYEPVAPTVYYINNDAGNYVVARINPTASSKEALATIETVFTKFNPSQPFEYQFVDEAYARKFGNEQRIGKLASAFASLAIFISCLGIFGLASFVAEQRTKEIGVRKVLGASLFDLWTLLSRDFAALVALACLVAIPLAYYFLADWLDNYEYHTALSWWPFVATLAGTLFITLATVSYQTIRAAMVNPGRSLKSE